MKTAEEWLKLWDKANVSDIDVEAHLANLRTIQLDAERSGYERGVREAASKAVNHNAPYDCQTCLSVARDAILSLLTKKEDA